MTYNTAVMRQALNLIDLHPEEHDQSVWRCKSGQCFAGWIAVATGAEWVVPFEEYAPVADKLEARTKALDVLDMKYNHFQDENGNWDQQKYEAFTAEREQVLGSPELKLTDEENEILREVEKVVVPNTGETLHVSEYAQSVIGDPSLGDAETRRYVGDLFSGDNTREFLHKAVDKIEAGEYVEFKEVDEDLDDDYERCSCCEDD